MNTLRTIGRDLAVLVLIGIALTAWLQPTIKVPDFVAMTIWITAAIMLVAFALWLIVWAADLSFDRLGEFFQNAFAQGAGKAILVVSFVAWFAYAVHWLHGSGYIEEWFDFSQRGKWFTSVFFVALAHLPLPPLINWIIPTSGIFVKAVTRTVFVAAVLISIAIILAPNNFFDRTAGASVAWIDPTTKKVYFRGGFSPETGEKLVSVAKKDAEELNGASLINQTKQMIDKSLREFVSKKEKDTPPPLPSAPPQKEEKKPLAALPAKEKRWRKATPHEYNLPSTWSVPGMPARQDIYRRGDVIRLSWGGKGFCGKIWAESGGLRSENGPVTAVSSCDQDLTALVTTDTARVWKGWCPAPERYCVVYD